MSVAPNVATAPAKSSRLQVACEHARRPAERQQRRAERRRRRAAPLTVVLGRRVGAARRRRRPSARSRTAASAGTSGDGADDDERVDRRRGPSRSSARLPAGPVAGVAVQVAEGGDRPVGRSGSRAVRVARTAAGPALAGSATASSVAVRIGLPVAGSARRPPRRSGRPGARGRRRCARARGRDRTDRRASAGPGSTGCRARGTRSACTSGCAAIDLMHLGDRVAGLAAGAVDGVVAAPARRQLGVDRGPEVGGQRQQPQVAVAA